MKIALFEPDIPQNLGSFIRLCACMGVELHIIEPCGFALDDKKIRRVSMDYFDHCTQIRHRSWEKFLTVKPGRLILLSTKAAVPYTQFAFQPEDILLLGRESLGVPEHVHRAADARLTIPIAQGMRSLNVVQAASMALGEAMRQTQYHAELVSASPAPYNDACR